MQELGVPQLVDHLGWKTDHLEVHDAASRVAVDDVDDAGQEGLSTVRGRPRMTRTTRWDPRRREGGPRSA